MVKNRSFLFTLLSLGLLSCTGDGPVTPDGTYDPAHAISDGAHNGGDRRFYFLPELTADPGAVGTFDGTLAPRIDICEWDGVCGATVASFVRGSTSYSSIEVGPSYYLLRWNTLNHDVTPGLIYRINVSLGERLLGYADVVIGRDRHHAKSLMTDEVFPLVDGGILPIKFLIVDATDDEAPTAVLTAPSSAPVGTPFTLSGAGSSDIGGSIVSYRWTRMATGLVIQTSESSISSSVFGSLPIGAHDFQLVVVDDSGNESAPAQARVFVLDNDAPTAVLTAPSSAPVGTPFTLSGAGSSDVGGSIVGYRWTRMATGVVIETSESSISSSVFGSLAIGAHDFQLVVIDDSGKQSAPAQARVVVVDNEAPTAILNLPTSVPFGTAFALDGQSSFDQGGGTVRRWVFAYLATGATVESGDPVLTSTVFGPLPRGRHVFGLHVEDDSGNASARVERSIDVF